MPGEPVTDEVVETVLELCDKVSPAVDCFSLASLGCRDSVTFAQDRKGAIARDEALAACATWKAMAVAQHNQSSCCSCL